MRAINQFMWGFQPHFRISLETRSQAVFKSIGVAVAPVVVLVGFEEEPGGHPICVEPEGIGIGPEALEDCMAKGDAAYENHEHRWLLNTDAELHDSFQTSLRDKCRATAVTEAMNSHVGLDTRRWFAGQSVRVGRYRVYPVIGVLRSTWDPLPSLTRRDRDHRNEMYLSFHEAVVGELLLSASFALSISNEPSGIRSDDRDEIIRRATNNFLRRLVYFKGDFMGGDLASAINMVAAQPYEGRTGVGTMLLASETDYSLELAFEIPISLHQTRALRKALEMTDSVLYLVTNGNVAIGLGKLADSWSPNSETAFHLRVTGRGSWELVHDRAPLLSVTDGLASVPRQRLDRSKFDDAVDRLFGDNGDSDRLWGLALAASRQAHGTMLVIHADAQGEAFRLSPPAMRVEPRPLTDSTLLAVSAIDGAIIVDSRGRCHAIGVILDGRAVPGLGDASRGARFNSAHRYLEEAGGSCLIIIVSEDGMLSLIPDLPRRVKRSYVENVLSEVESLSREEPVDFEKFHKHEDHLRSLAFYLTPEQCARANGSRERVEDFRESLVKSHGGLGDIMRIGYELLEPNPRLDDTVFLQEDD